NIHGLVLLPVAFTLILDSRSTLLVLFVSLSSFPSRDDRFVIGTPFSTLPPCCSILVPSDPGYRSTTFTNDISPDSVLRLRLKTTTLNLDACSESLVFLIRIKYCESPLYLITSSEMLASYLPDFGLPLIQSHLYNLLMTCFNTEESTTPLHILSHYRGSVKKLLLRSLSRCLLHHLITKIFGHT
ncbi:hypothetical protein BKA60DRAFT_257548, partial [Fusarium oxysporum]